MSERNMTDRMIGLSTSLKRMAREQRAKGFDQWVLTAYHAQLIDNELFLAGIIEDVATIGDEQFRELE